MDVAGALTLLTAESNELDTLVSSLTAEQWLTPTPSEGWNIADQIAHLHWTDRVSMQTITRDPAFDELVQYILKSDDPDFLDREAHTIAQAPPAELLQLWREGREALNAGLAAADPGAQIAWFGPPMRPITMATARIMETWAHSLDVFDALGKEKPATATLTAVARIGVRTRDFAFKSRGLQAPQHEFRVELDMPEGERLEFGPEDSEDRVVGSAWAFAAVVTQRRNIADVDLTTSGQGAAKWMQIAQAFAGLPTEGPKPGERGSAK